MRRIIAIFTFLVLFSISVSATGICSLNKELYIFGETATFSCSCDTTQEENRAGFIVWKNSTDTILKSIAANSGTCTADVFGDSFIFGNGAGFDGNVTFALNADGTGSPLQWGNIDDVTFDNFSVSNASIIDCLITPENLSLMPGGFPLGRIGAMVVNVKDGQSSIPLLHAFCSLHIKTVGGLTKLNVPYTPTEHDHRTTNGQGNVYFQHKMDENFWEPSTTYLMDIECHCGPSGSDEECFFMSSINTSAAGARSCTFETFFITDGDFRHFEGSSNMLSIIVGLCCVIVYLSLVSFVNFKMDKNKISFWISFVSGGLAIIELLMLVGIIFINEAGGLLRGLLEINFYVTLLLGGGMGIITIYIIITKLMNLDPNEKW